MTMDDNEELTQTLLDHDQPSWVTLSKGDHNNNNNEEDSDLRGGEARSSAWDSNHNNNMNSSTVVKKNHRGKLRNELPKFIPLLRIANMGTAILLIYGSIGNLSHILSPSKMILGGYGICFGLLLCCFESNLSFVRHPIASSFGFLYNPILRFIFYILLSMLSYSFESILGYITACTLGVLSMVNTFVLCRYPGYGSAIQELSDAEERTMRRLVREQMFRHATVGAAAPTATPWWEV